MLLFAVTEAFSVLSDWFLAYWVQLGVHARQESQQALIYGFASHYLHWYWTS